MKNKYLFLVIFFIFLVHPLVTVAEQPHPIRKIIKVKHNGTHFYAVYDHVLGDGSYGEVLLAEDINSHQELAVKVQSYVEQEDIAHEIKQLSLLGEYQGSAIVKEEKENMHYMFSTLAKGVAVNKLYFNNIKYDRNDILDIIYSSFCALKSIHDKNIVHNDIHEGNLVFNFSDKKSHWVDLAFSVQLRPDSRFYKIKKINKETPPVYKAPESNMERSLASDIYQLGFMSLRLLLIMQEEDHAVKAELINSRRLCLETIKKGRAKCLRTLPNDLAKIYDLLYRMISEKKEDRPTLNQAIKEFEAHYSPSLGLSR